MNDVQKEALKKVLSYYIHDEKIIKKCQNEIIRILETLKESKNTVSKFDSVQNPSHYVEGRKYEPRKVIHDWGLNFNLGNAVKYISRAGRKESAVEDLKKAIQYIAFEIEELEKDD